MMIVVVWRIAVSLMGYVIRHSTLCRELKVEVEPLKFRPAQVW